MKNSMKIFGFCMLLVITLTTVVLMFIQYANIEELERTLTDQKSKFDHESSYVVETAESTILKSLKIEGEKFTITNFADRIE